MDLGKAAFNKIEGLAKTTIPVINVLKEGVVAGNVYAATSNTTILNSLLTQGKNLYIPETLNDYLYVNETIVIPPYQTVKGAGSLTKIKVVDNTNKHVFRLKYRSQLNDLEIYLDPGTKKAAIYLNADDKISYAKASRIFVRGYYNQWTLSEDSQAVLCEGGTDPAGEIYHCNFDEISSWETTTGIKCLQNGANVNGNTFTNLNLINNKYAIDGNPNGSIFTFQTQSPQKLADGTPTGVSAVRCSGAENTFDGYMYDTQYISYNYEFTSASKNNSYKDLTGLWKYQKTKDAGKDNTAIGADKFDIKQFVGIGGITGADAGGSNQEYNGFFGLQDNALSYANKRDTVKLNSGTITYGAVSNIFNSDGPYESTIFSDPSITPVEIEVILTNKLYNITHLGVLFGTPAKTFEIWTKANTGDAYTKYLTVTDNNRSNWQLHPHPVGISSLAAIKFIFKEAVYFSDDTANNKPGYNLTKIFSIKSIWCNDSLYGGNVFLKKGGGTLYGNITYQKGYGTILTSPKGTTFKQSIDDQGKLSVGSKLVNMGFSGTSAQRPNINLYVGMPYYDTTLKKQVNCDFIGVKQVESFSVTGGATATGNISITLDGITTNVAVSAGDSASVVADKIRATNFPGWTVGGVGTNTPFESESVGVKPMRSTAGNGTGVTVSSPATYTVGVPAEWRDGNGTSVWTPNKAYALNDKIVTDNNYYQCTVAGTTGTTMPTHTTGTATDGAVTWTFLKSII